MWFRSKKGSGWQWLAWDQERGNICWTSKRSSTHSAWMHGTRWGVSGGLHRCGRTASWPRPQLSWPPWVVRSTAALNTCGWGAPRPRPVSISSSDKHRLTMTLTGHGASTPHTSTKELAGLDQNELETACQLSTIPRAANSPPKRLLFGNIQKPTNHKSKATGNYAHNFILNGPEPAENVLLTGIK